MFRERSGGYMRLREDRLDYVVRVCERVFGLSSEPLALGLPSLSRFVPFDFDLAFDRVSGSVEPCLNLFAGRSSPVSSSPVSSSDLPVSKTSC